MNARLLAVPALYLSSARCVSSALCVVAMSCSSRGEVLFTTPLPTQTVQVIEPRPALIAPDGGAALPRPAADVYVASGDEHACALVGGRAYCWGANDSGQLGVGDAAQRSSPVGVASELSFAAIEAGYAHSCALDDVGAVHCWGENDHGQLGLGDRNARDVPNRVALPLRATKLVARFDHTCAVLNDASLYCWGRNAEGDLGQDDGFVQSDDTSADAVSPVPLPLPGVRTVGVGQGHGCAIALDGALYCWGRNSERELGAGDQIQIRAPLRVGTDLDWLALSLGQQHTCALKADGTLWCWGQNTGVGSDDGAPLGVAESGQIDEPTRIGTESDWLVLSTDTFHTCVIDRAEQMFCAGRGIEGQLGTGSTFAPLLERVPGNFARVSAGHFFTCTVTTEGLVACTGENDRGQLGVGDTERRAVFTSGE
jgi:alpha-tubulin suppressor-like RCC1 family protein